MDLNLESRDFVFQSKHSATLCHVATLFSHWLHKKVTEQTIEDRTSQW